jgi:hypothetical protein
MKSRLLLSLLLLTACQSGTDKPAGGGNAALRRDLDKICNAKKLSGAAEDASGQGTMMMAQWLNANITSEEGHAFLVEFAKLGQDKDARRKKLEDAAKANGIATCPLIDDWR